MKQNSKNMKATFNLTTNSDGVLTINVSKTVRQTRYMVADQKNRQFEDISLSDKLDDDLGYEERDRIAMKQLIEEVYFVPYSPTADVDFLKKVDTVRNLADKIYKSFIPAKHRG